MKTLPLLSHLCLCGLLAFALPACSLFKKKKEYAGVSDSDIISGTPMPERRGDGVSFTGANVDRAQLSPVYFAFDSSEVRAADAGRLDEVAAFLKSSGKEIVLAGFTDERGTAEYNRGLGERRAQAVRAQLLSRGVRNSRIQTTSFGAEMPADPGSNEAAWARNRRVEFGVIR